jgi:hypothetical protein
MREFNPPVRAELRQAVIDLVEEILDLAPKIKWQHGRDLAMDDEEAVVSRSTRIDLGEEVGEVTVAASEASARPPFEWLVEVTADINERGYLKHYLVRDNDVVLAHRKVLTEIDDAEAELLIADLRQTLAFLK